MSAVVDSRLRRDAVIVRRVRLLRLGRALARCTLWASAGYLLARLFLACAGGAP